MAIMANPDNNSEVVAVAFSLALDLCNLLQDKPSGVFATVLNPFRLVSIS